MSTSRLVLSPVHVAATPQCYGHFGARVAIPLVADAGLERFELPIRTAGFVTRLGDPPIVSTDSPIDELHEVKRYLLEHGITPTSSQILSGSLLDEHVVELTRQKLALTAFFDIPVAVGDIGVPAEGAQRQRLIDNLRRVGDYAALHRVTYCCETHPGLGASTDSLLRTMEAVDHPQVRINLDTANLLFYERGADLLASVRRLAPFIGSFHLKDWSGQPDDWNFPAIGQGSAIDWADLWETLRDCGWRGVAAIEVQGTRNEPPLSLEGYHARLVQSVTHLRQCGWPV